MKRHRTKNVAIGDCPCSVKKCELTVPVFRYRSQSGNANRSVRAGKLYIVCPEHGKAEPQEFILANADITGEPPTLVEQISAKQREIDAATPPPVVEVSLAAINDEPVIEIEPKPEPEPEPDTGLFF